ncbi:glycosyltransferase family 4 protein [Geobacter grbiciae]|uniref:glycosyltransferase family 4 protein n=1 Tax=Geobacter grbiciae TaxID=155042 RepID=UPI001C01AADA|nr:glycosyltransferase family 4 protein [Geobacter grbiciae]MBT1074657.1 glycosyltransferase family 4 protein [Geobacter grbiciae]
MKMLFITDKFPPVEGGSRIYYYNLCVNYPHEEVVVFTKKVDGYKDFDKKQKMKIIRKGIPLSNWKYYQVPRMFLTFLWTIYLVYKESIDVIHCGDFMPAGIIGYLAKKFFNKPYVYYVHEGDYWYFDRFRFKPKLRRLVLGNADQIVAACTNAEVGVKHSVDNCSDKITIITPGVDYKRFTPGEKNPDLVHEFNLEQKKVILTVGRLVDGRKGHEMIIRALPSILEEVPNAVYLIAGRGPYEDFLKELVHELNLDTHVRFAGYVPNDLLPNIYGISDVFAMISRETPEMGTEGFGMVFTEANAAGKPVVGGKCGGTEDSIIDGVTGYRVDPSNVDEVISRIIKLLKDDVFRESMGATARKWVEETSDWVDKAKQIEQVNHKIALNYATH